MKRRMSRGSHRSDSEAMASAPSDVTTSPEAAESTEDCSGKKKSRFQALKKFFTRRKRKDPSGDGVRGSQSSDNLSKTSDNNTLPRSEKDRGSGSRISLGSKALSHDSVFVSDSSEANEANEALRASQDSISGKVKSLQMQLKQAMRLGSPPSLSCVKKTEDPATMSEDDGLPCSPPEYGNHTTKVKAQRNSSISLDSDEDQLSCGASRAVSPLVAAPGDFSTPASPLVCLDNSAAKHRLGLRQKACNKRKPVSRLELKTEADSFVDDSLNSSTPEAEEVCDEELKPDELKVEGVSVENGSEEEEHEEEEAEVEVDMSHKDTCPIVSCEETPGDDEDRDSTSSTPEPCAGDREYLLDPPGFNYGSENYKPTPDQKLPDDLKLQLPEDMDAADETEERPLQVEEESSLLQEVLSSLKTPLTRGLETERDVPESVQNENVGQTKAAEEDLRDEEDEDEEEEAVAVTSESVSEDGEVQEEAKETQEVEPERQEVEPERQEVEPETQEVESIEQEVVVSFYKDADDDVKSTEEETEEDEEEEPVVEHFRPDELNQETETEDIQKVQHDEDSALYSTQSDNEAQETQEMIKNQVSDEDEDLEKTEQEPEEIQEKDDVTKAAILELEQEEEGEIKAAILEEADEMQADVLDDEQREDEEKAAILELKETKAAILVEAAILEDDSAEECIQETNNDDEKVKMTVAVEEDIQNIENDQEIDTQDVANVAEVDTDLTQEEIGVSKVDASEDFDQVEENVSEEEEDMEVTVVEVVDMDKNDQEEVEEVSQEEVIQEKEEEIEEKPLFCTQKSNTATLHINLVSPTAEKVSAPVFEDLKEEVKKEDDKNEEVIDAKGEEISEECEAPKVDHGKPRFTIAPAWQRSLSIGDKDEAFGVTTSVAGEDEKEEVKGEEKMEEKTVEKMEEKEAKVELVLSPTKTNMAVTPQTEESPADSDGNSHNPFGVRLRRTQALQRFISEDQHTEPVHEAPTQTTKPEPPQSPPPSVAPAVGTKPAVPKKPVEAPKTKRVSDSGVSRSEAPSWISMAKQKQKIYKENSVENIAVNKEESERKPSLTSVKETSKTQESKDLHRPLEKVSHRPLSPPAPVPPVKVSHMCPTSVPVKPLSPPPQPTTLPHTSPPSTPQKPNPVPPLKPSHLCPTSVPVKSPPPMPTTSPPSHASPQDEPPWMALAKKKAKAWSEMPQIVQ